MADDVYLEIDAVHEKWTVDQEIELAKRIGLGDHDAFAEVYETYNKSLFLYIRRRLSGWGSKEDAEDLLEEAFLSFYTDIWQFDVTRAPLRGFLFMKAKNKIAKFGEKAVQEDQVVAKLTAEFQGHRQTTTRGHYSRKDQLIDVFDAMEKHLTAREKEVFQLHIEGFTSQEIADHLGGVRDTTVRSWLLRSKRKIHKALFGEKTASD